MARLLGLKKAPVFKEDGDVKVTTEFGKNIKDYPEKGKTGDHNGLDIVRSTDGTSAAATVCAIEDGVVTAQRKWVKGFRSDSATGGNCVYIKHENGMTSKYLHLKYGTVPERIADGVTVKKGEKLGYMGSTGYSFGVHLHFQVEDEKGKPVDPEPYLLGSKSFDKTACPYGLMLTCEFGSKTEAESALALLKKAGISARLCEI